MQTESFTVALYLLSSLLQADAAILGLGMVFVVYRLQHLYGVYQHYVTLLLGCDLPGAPQDCSKIIKGATAQEVDQILAKYKEHRFSPAFEFIAESRRSLQEIKRRFVPPLIVVAFHCLISSASLWYMSFLSPDSTPQFAQIWGGIIVLGFLFALLEIITGAQAAFEAKPLIKGFPLSSRIFKLSE